MIKSSIPFLGLLFAFGCASAAAPKSPRTPKLTEPDSRTAESAPAEPEVVTPSPSTESPASPADPSPTQSPACTEAALLPSTRQSRHLNHDRPYRIVAPRCIGEFASATLQLTDRPDDQVATVVWGFRDSSWQVITVGTWIECTDLRGEVPAETCEQLLATGEPLAP